MKSFITLLSFLLIALTGFSQTYQPLSMLPDSTKKMIIVDAACGQCKMGLPGKGCNLAVRIDGKAYFVDGTSIDDHGDAHAKEGFCNAIRKASVQGEIVNDRFKASYFKLVPAVKKPQH